MIAVRCFPCHAVLHHQNKRRQQHSFHRDNHGEEYEGVRIEWVNTGNQASVDSEPQTEDADVQDDELNRS